jgi:hypothetical protein
MTVRHAPNQLSGAIAPSRITVPRYRRRNAHSVAVPPPFEIFAFANREASEMRRACQNFVRTGAPTDAIPNAGVAHDRPSGSAQRQQPIGRRAHDARRRARNKCPAGAPRGSARQPTPIGRLRLVGGGHHSGDLTTDQRFSHGAQGANKRIAPAHWKLARHGRRRRAILIRSRAMIVIRKRAWTSKLRLTGCDANLLR